MNIRQQHKRLNDYILDQFPTGVIVGIETVVGPNTHAIVRTINADNKIKSYCINTDEVGNFLISSENH